MAARGGADGSAKNKERIDKIKSQGGARINLDEPLIGQGTDKQPASDLEYLSRRNLNQLNGQTGTD
jgi:hypothetical protein